MENSRVIKVDSESIEFDNGVTLSSYHDQNCCESHFLSFKDLSLSDFDGLEFDLSGEGFFRRIDGYGIELIPVVGHSVKVPGYGYNNGYYSSRLDLVVSGPDFQREYNISECQVIK